MRTILYTGKGGVGKTSIAAASAVRAADLGHRTVVMSTDPAHSLGDSLDITLGGDPVPVAPNLWAQEIDVFKELDVQWRTVQRWLAALMRWQGADEIVAEELAVLPGMEELVALLYIGRFNREGDYDLLVVDCAPTAETLRLLSFPEMARWYMSRLFPVERKVAAALGPMARGILGLPVPEPEVFDSIKELYLQLEDMRQILLDPDHASVRLVVNPEKMVIREAHRTFTYLNLYGYPTDAVICNRVLPDTVVDGFFQTWKEAQGRYRSLVRESFEPIPVLEAPLLDREVVGLDSLRELASATFDSRDPADVFYHGRSREISKRGNRYTLSIKLPFTSKDELSVIESGDELVVQVGHYRRNILLPRLLARLHVDEAKMDGDTLEVVFKESRAAGGRSTAPKSAR